ncbi:hypothetical protein T484DRAFT_3313974 [Baffinella frigidus]|nr:hypothetical protein T484DRAFT_3313974 [Cryptophyta sp. CCMP2293]
MSSCRPTASTRLHLGFQEHYKDTHPGEILPGFPDSPPYLRIFRFWWGGRSKIEKRGECLPPDCAEQFLSLHVSSRSVPNLTSAEALEEYLRPVSTRMPPLGNLPTFQSKAAAPCRVWERSPTVRGG